MIPAAADSDALAAPPAAGVAPAPDAATAPAPPPPDRVVRYRPAWEITLAARRTQRTGYRPEDYGPADPLPSRKRLRGLFHRARDEGARFVLLRSAYGAAALEETQAQARFLGYRGYFDYVAHACAIAASVVGPGGRRLLPAVEFAPASPDDLARLAPRVDHFRLAVDALDPRLLDTDAFRDFPDKRPEVLRSQLDMFRMTGVRTLATMMIGVGESPASRRELCALLADARAGGLRLAGLIAIPFVPLPHTPMARAPIVAAADVLAALDAARAALPPDVPLLLQLEGRLDLLDLARDGRLTDAGFVVLNRRLLGDTTERQWFEANVGPIDRHRAGGAPLVRDGVRWEEVAATGPWPADARTKD